MHTKQRAQKPVQVTNARVKESLRQESLHQQIAELDEALAISSKISGEKSQAIAAADCRTHVVQTVLNLSIERAAQRANAAIVEYDSARVELSRLTGDPSFALGKTLPLIQLPRTTWGVLSCSVGETARERG